MRVSLTSLVALADQAIEVAPLRQVFFSMEKVVADQGANLAGPVYQNGIID
jgi:hypothetical protein